MNQTHHDNVSNLQLSPRYRHPSLTLQYFYRSTIYCHIILKTLLLDIIRKIDKTGGVGCYYHISRQISHGRVQHQKREWVKKRKRRVGVKKTRENTPCYKKKIKTSHNECKMQYSPSPPMPL